MFVSSFILGPCHARPCSLPNLFHPLLPLVQSIYRSCCSSCSDWVLHGFHEQRSTELLTDSMHISRIFGRHLDVNSFLPLIDRFFFGHLIGSLNSFIGSLLADILRDSFLPSHLSSLSFCSSSPPPPPRGYDSSHFLRTENSFGIIWSSPRQLRVKNTLRVGHRGPVGRKTTQKPPQNTKKWKKIVKKRLFSRFGHFGQNSDFSRKKSKTGIFFDITKPPLAQIYPKSGL